MKRPKIVSVWIPPESVIRHLAMYMESMLIEHAHDKKRAVQDEKRNSTAKINQSRFKVQL